MLRRFAVLALVLSLAGVCSNAQPPVPQAPASQAHPGKPPEPTPEEVRRDQKMKEELAKQRYQQMRRDTEQLVLLSNQLKRYVDTAGEHTLSVEVIKKAEEIEKLAHSIRTKMKGD